jgi:hypothetical protein
VSEPRTLLVPTARLERWVANFGQRHGGCVLDVADGRLAGSAPDGSVFSAAPPFGRVYGGAADVFDFVASCAPPERWGLLLVRKGGFAVARLSGDRLVEHKIGQRHVQGRTKAGGQSQQRFARRRDNQARQAFEAAADHAARILGLLGGSDPVVAGGDHAAVEAVLADPRLTATAIVPPFLTVPDPRRAVLDAAVGDACSVRMSVTNA